MSGPPLVEPLGAEAADEVISVLADAFTGYPVVAYVLGPDLARHHEALVRLFVMARVLRGEPMFGVREGGELVAAGTLSFPGPGQPTPPEFTALREQTWRQLGPEAERRYAAYGEATSTFAFPSGSVHVNMVGARRGRQRRGMGRAILDAAQDLALARPGAQGVELTTERLENVAYYTGLGFQLVGHAVVGPGLESWGFFRPNERPYAPIDCSIHDRLEAAATLGRDVALTYEQADGRRETRRTRIVDVGARGGAEFVRLASGEDVRLDRIVEVDGVEVRTRRP